MQVYTIAQINGFPDGTPVTAFKGTVVEVSEYRSSTNAHGPWSFQNLTVKDESGASIKVKLKNRDAFPAGLRGSACYFSCVDGKNGLTGVKAEDDTYNGRTNRILLVTGSALIDLVDDAQTAPPQEPAQTAPAPKPGPLHNVPPQNAPAPTTPAPTGHGNGRGEIRMTLNRLANLYLDCLLAADYVATTWEEIHGQPMTMDQRQAATSGLFIQATRTGLDMKAQVGKFSKP